MNFGGVRGYEKITQYLKKRKRKMKTISNKKYAEYEQYQSDIINGRILTPDGLKLICEANNLDPMEIGLHFLRMYAKFDREKPTSL